MRSSIERMPGWAAVVLAGLLCAGCLDTGPGQNECETAGDCPAGQECTAGICQPAQAETDGGLLDGDPGSSQDEDIQADEPGPTCPDGTCDPDEDCTSCPADAFLASPSPCADYFISLPAIAGNKTQPRGGGQPDLIRAHGRRFHAMAEFHWTGWSSVAGSWYDKGVEFRRRMQAAGYDEGGRAGLLAVGCLHLVPVLDRQRRVQPGLGDLRHLVRRGNVQHTSKSW